MNVTKENLQTFISTLKQNSDYDLTLYSENSLLRRIEKVLTDYSLSFNDLLNRITESKDFSEDVLKKITVNTTELFRDFKVWQELRHVVMPEFNDYPTLNIWHIGSSTGQEVYSMAILLHELDLLDKTNIYASDINVDVIEQAKSGILPYRHVNEYIESFKKVIIDNPYGDSYKHNPFEFYFEVNHKKEILRVKPFITQKVNFFKQNLVEMENNTGKKFDLIFCRNVLIYFNMDLQKSLYDYFYKNLNSQSYLIIGMQESIGWFMNSMFDKKGNFYKRRI